MSPESHGYHKHLGVIKNRLWQEFGDSLALTLMPAAEEPASPWGTDKTVRNGWDTEWQTAKSRNKVWKFEMGAR